MARQRARTNYFPFSTPAGFYMDYWAGALYAEDLVKFFMRDYDEAAPREAPFMVGDSLDKYYRLNLSRAEYFTEKDLKAIQSIYRKISDMERELSEKTYELEKESPTDIVYFYTPTFTDVQGGFTLCGLTRVDNNVLL